MLHILGNHEGNLKGNGILKDTQIKTGALLQFIQTVNQGISVDIQLSEVSDTFKLFSKNLLMVVKGFLIKLVWGFAVKYFTDKHLAQRDRKLVDQTADSQVTYRRLTFLY